MRQLPFITRLVPNRHEVNDLCALSPVFVTFMGCIRAIYSGINWELAQLNGSHQGRQINGNKVGKPSGSDSSKSSFLSPRVSCFTCQANVFSLFNGLLSCLLVVVFQYVQTTEFQKLIDI